MTSGPPSSTPRRRRRWPWFALASLLILAGLGAAAWYASQRVWTDGGSLRVPMFGGDRVRQILWSQPISPGPQFDSADQVYEPAISPDGEEFFFVRGMPDSPEVSQNVTKRNIGHSHIFVSYRKDNAWTPPARLSDIDPAGAECDDLSPRLSPDGKFLYFSSNRPGGFGGYDIWAAARNAKAIGGAGGTGGAGGWSKPFNLGPSINTQYNEYDPDPTPDGKHLIFTTNRTAAAAAQNDVWRATIRQTDAADYDLWIADAVAPSETSRHAAAQPPVSSSPATQPATKTGVTGPGSDQIATLPNFSNPHPIVALNTPYIEGASCMSPAGDFLYFTSNRPGGFGKFDLYRSRVIAGVFGPPENLGPSINSADNDTDPAIAADGYRIYFSSDRPTSDVAGAGRYHLLTADSREVFPEEQAHTPHVPALPSLPPLPHFGWSIWGVLGCGVAALLLILLLRGSDNRKLNLLQKCLVISILVHVLFTFSLSFVALTQQVTHYVQHGMSTPMAFVMPKDLAEKLAVRSQADTLPLPPPPPKNLPLSQAVQIPSEPLPPPPNVQVSVPDVHPRVGGAGAVQIAVAAPHPPDIAPPPLPTVAVAPSVPQVAPAPVAIASHVQLPQPLHVVEPTIAPPVPAPLPAAQQQVAPTNSHAPPIDLGQPTAPSAAPRGGAPAAVLPPMPDAVASASPPIAPDPDSPAPPPPLPAPQVNLNPTVSRVAPQQPPTPDNPSATADALAGHQQPLGNADQRTAHSTGPADVPLDSPPIKNSRAINSPAEIAMAMHNAGAPNSAGANVLPGVAATQPAQIADAPQADLPSGLATDTRVAPTAQPAWAAADSPADSHIGPTALAAPTQTPRYAAAQLPDSPAPPTNHPARAPIADDPALGWHPTNQRPLSAGQPAAPTAQATLAQAPSIAVAPPAPIITHQPTQLANTNPNPAAAPGTGPVTVASARLPADAPPSAPADPDLGDIPSARGPRDLPGNPARGNASGHDALAMAPMSHIPGVSAPAVLPQVMLQPLTGLTGPSSAFASRAPQQRPELLKQNGGTKLSEDAVDRGLAYLASAQESDGRWTRVVDDSPPGHRRPGMHDMACTGLALLAFLARDQTPDKPCQYRDIVAKAADYLLSQEGPDGDMRGPSACRGGGADHANMYDHGIASFAMGELAAMTHDPRYIQATLKAADFIVAAQNPQTGGWRYLPGEPGDSSVFGWQIMSLHTAALIGYTIPQSTLDGAKKFIGIVSQGEFGTLASYQGRGAPTPPMTAEILFSRMLLHHKLTEPEIIEATGFLDQQKPNPGNPDLYYWYYASLSMLQMNDTGRLATGAWKTWNTQTRDALIAMQQKGGYWDINIRWGDRGGRIFTTAIATLTLEVYYRYLPLQPTTRPQITGQ